MIFMGIKNMGYGGIYVLLLMTKITGLPTVHDC